MELGYFSTSTCVALTLSTDGFQAWRQRGFERWPIIVASNKIIDITPGPGQPVYLESFLHPIAKELNVLVAGVSGVTVAGFSEPQVVQAFVLQFNTDMPSGDKLLNAIGWNGEHPSRFRDFAGFWHKRRYYYPPYARDGPPPSKHTRCFSVPFDYFPTRCFDGSSAMRGRQRVDLIKLQFPD